MVDVAKLDYIHNVVGSQCKEGNFQAARQMLERCGSLQFLEEQLSEVKCQEWYARTYLADLFHIWGKVYHDERAKQIARIEWKKLEHLNGEIGAHASLMLARAMSEKTDAVVLRETIQRLSRAQKKTQNTYRFEEIQAELDRFTSVYFRRCQEEK